MKQILQVYTKDNCPYCTRAKQFLDHKNIPYEELNIVQTPEYGVWLKAQGHSTVPQIYANGKLFVGGGCTGLLSMSDDDLHTQLVLNNIVLEDKND